ncbi:MAG: ATP synthase F0 subunit C [Clostridia bacterium]|nr:ATP synthase F0 subunit C [Clostridia bacterium]
MTKMDSSAMIALAAAIAIAVSTIAPAIAQGLTAKSAMESIARQPDAAKDIRSTLIIALALMEALTIYGLLIAFMLISKI